MRRQGSDQRNAKILKTPAQRVGKTWSMALLFTSTYIVFREGLMAYRNSFFSAEGCFFMLAVQCQTLISDFYARLVMAMCMGKLVSMSLVLSMANIRCRLM